MRPRVRLIVICLLAVNAAPTFAAPITYNIVEHPALQNGHTLTGSITTDGTLGPLDPSNIVSWIVDVDGPLSFTLSSDNPSAYCDLNPYHDYVIATEDSIELVMDVSYFELLDGDYKPRVYWGTSGGFVNYLAYDSLGNEAWNIFVDNFTATWTIATAESNCAVPEPSTFALLSIGLLSIGGYATRKRKV